MLVTGEIYHLINRGVDGRDVFQTRRDRERFLLTILECNDLEISADNRCRRTGKIKMISDFDDKKNKPLAEISCVCLMPNHYHIAAKQVVDGGISKLMQRVGNSYTKYFNIKNERKGSLFMSRYKSVHISSDIQLKHLVTYIHANALDLCAPEWRRGKLTDANKAKKFLESYEWSTFPLYIAKNPNPIIEKITNKEMADMFYPDKNDHFEAIESWSSRYFDFFNSNELE